MWRNVLAVIAGIIVWMAGFFAIALGVGLFWPAYAGHGRTWAEQSVFTFTAPMAVCNLVFWVIAAFAAGAVATRIARQRGAVVVMAILIWGYAMAMHVVFYWPRFPWWYNLGVVIPLLPAAWLGSRWAGKGPGPVEGLAVRS